MSTDRDFDRIARAWLDLMPDEAPHRTVAAVLQAVETTPQVRRPWRPPWKETPMTRFLVPISVAAAIVVSAAVLLFGQRSQPNVGPQMTPSPSASSLVTASPSDPVPPVGGPVPSELEARWMGGHNDIVAGSAGSSILLDGTTLAVQQSNANGASNLLAGASAIGPGRLRLESTNVGPCLNREVGEYAWTRSSSGRVLTISAVRDDCAGRVEAVAGTWWRMDCRDPGTNCLGDLDAGTYASQYIVLRTNPAKPWAPDFGALTYGVPDGWANYADWPSQFGLTTSAAFANTTASDLEPQVSIQVLPDPSALKSSCTSEPEPGIANTVDAQLAWLEQNPGLVVSRPGNDPFAVDKHDGAYVDLSVAPGYTECGTEVSYMLTPAGTLTAGSNGRERLILVDLGDGHLVAIVIQVHDASRFEEFVGAAMAIVPSFAFK
jgi:hypothetical protein